MSMTDDEFKQKLSEVAEWGLPKLEQATRTVGLAKHRRGRPPRVSEDVTDDDTSNDQEDVNLVKDGANITYAPMLVKLKIQPTTCTDCGRYCEHGRQTEAQIYFKNGNKYVREKCFACKRHKDPYTGEFTLNPHSSSVVWHTFMKTSGLKRYTTKRTAADEQGREYEEIETDTEIIKKYRE
jgi:hypothetical protein